MKRQPHLIARGSGDSIVPAPMPKPIALKPEPRPTSKLDAHELRSLLATQRRTRSVTDLQVSVEMVNELTTPKAATPMPARLAHTLRRAPKQVAAVAPIQMSVAPVELAELAEMPLPEVDGTPVIAMSDATTVPVVAPTVVAMPEPVAPFVEPSAPPAPIDPAYLAMGSTTMPMVELIVTESAPVVAPARNSRMHDLLIGLGIGGAVIAGVLVALTVI